jgi:hypothetical protein
MMIRATIASALSVMFFSNPLHALTSHVSPNIYEVPPSEMHGVVLVPAVTEWGHHFVCVYMITASGIEVGTMGETTDSAHELQLCRDNQDEWFYQPDREVLSPDEFSDVLEEYVDTWANEGVGNAVIECVGSLCVPFTLGVSKPCYMESMGIMGIAQECSQQ